MGGSESKPVSVPVPVSVSKSESDPVSVPELECTRQEGRRLSPPSAEDLNAFEEAIRNGKAERVEEMVRGCPRLLAALTRAGETPFHLAIKADQFGCLRVLLMRAGDGMSHQNLQMILNRQDQDGNTVLDLWYTFADRLNPQITSALLGDYMALDVDPDASNLATAQASQRARHRPMGLLSRAFQSNSKTQRAKAAGKEISKVSALVTVCTFVAAAAFTCLFSLDTIFPMDSSTHDMKMMEFYNLPPDDFVFLVFNTAAFIGSMLLILTNTCSLVAKWSFFYRVVPMVVMAALFASYALVLKNVVPKHLCFTVASQSCSISGFAMVWIYNFGLLSSALALWLIGSKICSAFSKPSA